MKIIFVSILSVGAFIFCACNNKIDFGPHDGIAYRDNLNQSGPSDPSDWTLDGTWNKEEKKLFNALEVDVNSAAQGGVQEVFFYPNPVNQQGNFGYYKTLTLSLSTKYVIVDRKYNVLESATLPSATANTLTVSLRFDDSKFKKGEIYRLYYVFYQGSTLHYKGHGDIKIAD